MNWWKNANSNREFIKDMEIDTQWWSHLLTLDNMVIYGTDKMLEININNSKIYILRIWNYLQYIDLMYRISNNKSKSILNILQTDIW